MTFEKIFPLFTFSVVTCATPNVPAYASIVPNISEVNYNTSITYVCDLGYNRTDGDETRRCREDATFEGVEANCTCTLLTCFQFVFIVSLLFFPTRKIVAINS